MGMGDALADVMLESQAATAESAANWARADAANVRSDLSRAEVKAVGYQVEARRWKDYAKQLEATLAEARALGSGCLVVVDAMVKVMESMPSAQREQFRERVVQISRARILQLDRESRNENGWVSIENAVKKDSFNNALKIV